jgi:hypothetical protein
MLLVALALGMSGCGSAGSSAETGIGEPTDTDADTDADTGAPACDGPRTSLPLETCLETTAPQPTATTYSAGDVVGARVVTEVGGALAPVAGSAPATGFAACGAGVTHQVRVVDGAGATWTFGWESHSALQDGSTAGLAGATVSFEAHRRPDAYAWDEDLALWDDQGPRVLLEHQYPLADPHGITVSDGAVCEQDAVVFTRRAFAGGADTVELWPGEAGPITVGGRTFQLLHGDDAWLAPCPTDWCGDAWWMGWTP